MARWAAGAKWAEGPAPDDQRDTPLVLSLSEGLGLVRRETGELSCRKETYAESLAIYSDPESCVGDGNGAGEALTGARAG